LKYIWEKEHMLYAIYYILPEDWTQASSDWGRRAGGERKGGEKGEGKGKEKEKERKNILHIERYQV
jgi:hypothetical protein